jgi:MFS family permease
MTQVDGLPPDPAGETAPPAAGSDRRRVRTFGALRVRNYRIYMSGQAISLVGTWMQTVAQSWLVLELTHSGTALGLVTAAQFLPVLLLASYGGLAADRLGKRRILLATQSTLMLLALVLGVLTITHTVRLWMVFVIALALGFANAFDNPARQSFAIEMVGRDLVRNAVSLNAVTVNAARTVGPAVAGLLIASVGVGVCFLLNAASYLAVLLSLARMDVGELHPAPVSAPARGQVREGLRYAAAHAEILVPLLMMALVGTLAYEFQVVLPLVAIDTLHGDASTYGFLTSAMGVGAIAGGLVVAGRASTGVGAVTGAALGFGIAIALAAVAPSLPLELAALLLVGAGSAAFISIGNATLQLASDPRFRGRVMALWAIAFLGSTPVGGPVVGAVAEHLGARAALGLGAVSCLVAAAGGGLARWRAARARAEISR